MTIKKQRISSVACEVNHRAIDPDICTVYCANWATDACPSTAECMAKLEKPFFKPKPKKQSWFARLRMKHQHKKFCRQMGYKCPDCIYHQWVWDDDGITFRGNHCLYNEKHQQ